MRIVPAVLVAGTVILVGCAPSEGTAAADTAAIESSVLAATDSAFQAVRNLSIDGFLALASEQPMADRGRLRTVEEVRTEAGDLYRRLRSLSPERERTLTYVLGPDAAVVVTEGPIEMVTLDGVTNSTRIALTFIWQRQGGSWRLLHFHQSEIVPAEEP